MRPRSSNTVKGGLRRSGKRSQNVVKKKRKKKGASGKAKIKKSFKKALLDFYIITGIFLVLLIFSSVFLLYQWKDYKIVEYGKEIHRLNGSMLQLKSDRSRYQAKLNSSLSDVNRIEIIARKKLGLKPSLNDAIVFKVNHEKLQYFIRKDEQKSSQN